MSLCLTKPLCEQVYMLEEHDHVDEEGNMCGYFKSAFNWKNLKHSV